MAAHDQHSDLASLINVVSLFVAFGWLVFWLIARWMARAADRGEATFGGASWSLDPEKIRQADERALRVQHHIVVVVWRFWPIAAIAAAVLVATVLISLG